MGDRILAHGLTSEGSFEPIQLWAGEPNGQTTQGVAAAGHKFGKLNARGETYKFPVVALVGGVLVPWNPLADSDVPNAFASGTVTFSTAPPADGDKVTIAGTDLTFVAADPGPMEVLIGGTIGATATNLANAINDLTNALGVTATVNAAVVTITANAPGTGGNAITLAKTAATPANITVSGATLAGGTNVTETISDVERGRWYQLGVTDDLPQGVRGVGSVTITGVDAGSVIVDGAAGRIFIKEDADDIVNGDDLEVAYGLSAGVDDIVISRTDTIEGEMTFIANNAAGANDDYFWPYVKLMPDGDFSLKGDEWLNMTFNFEILKRDAMVERQYITRRRAA